MTGTAHLMIMIPWSSFRALSRRAWTPWYAFSDPCSTRHNHGTTQTHTWNHKDTQTQTHKYIHSDTYKETPSQTQGKLFWCEGGSSSRYMCEGVPSRGGSITTSDVCIHETVTSTTRGRSHHANDQTHRQGRGAHMSPGKSHPYTHKHTDRQRDRQRDRQTGRGT